MLALTALTIASAVIQSAHSVEFLEFPVKNEGKAYYIKSPKFPLSRWSKLPITGPVQGVCAAYGLEDISAISYELTQAPLEKAISLDKRGRAKKEVENTPVFKNVYCAPSQASIITASSIKVKFSIKGGEAPYSIRYKLVAPLIKRGKKFYKISGNSDLENVCATFGIRNASTVLVSRTAPLKSKKVFIARDESIRLRKKTSKEIARITCFKEVQTSPSDLSSDDKGNVQIYHPDGTANN